MANEEGLYTNLGGGQWAQNTVLTGSTVDLRGLAANKPLATTVDMGVTYWSVDTGVVEVSTGTNWVVV